MNAALLTRSVFPLHAPGGMERAVYELARALRGRGVGSVLVTRPALHDASFPGDVVTVPWGGRNGEGHARVLDRVRHYPGFADRVGAATEELVRAGRVQVVDAQGLTALGYAQRRRRDRTLRAPVLMNPQGMEEHRTTGLKRLALLPLRRLSRRAAQLSDRVVATDEATRDDVPRLLGVPPGKVVVLPNGIDLAALDAAPRATSAEPGLAGADIVFLSVGRLEAYKGFRDTLEALVAMASRGELPSGWRWFVVGTGPDRAVLERAAPDGGHVVFTGAVDEARLRALYAAAHVFVHPTRFEGSSLVTLEAMAHGLPAVATRAGGIPDKVADGVNGLLVTPGDTLALQRALARMVQEPGIRAAMGRAGRERVRAFDWSVLVDRVLGVYDDMLREAA